MFLKGANEGHKTWVMERKGEQVHFVIRVNGESYRLTHLEHTKKARQWECPLMGWFCRDSRGPELRSSQNQAKQVYF